jgi:FkbM family methyltransferase
MSEIVLPRPELTGDDYFDLAAALAALAEGRAIAFPPFELVHLAAAGVTFCLNMERDPVQRAIRNGGFYEEPDLDRLAAALPVGATVIDVGANIGNHTLYFATRAQAAQVVPIEPNQLALAPLVANVVINGLTGVIDLSRLGVGLSDRDAGGFGMKRHDRNLGATKMKPGKGDLRVCRGDTLFADLVPHLIKIDVEGMELGVLRGLSDTIARARPMIFVEVDHDNAEGFAAWCAAAG